MVNVIIDRGRLYNGCLRAEQIGLTAQQGDLNQTRGLIPLAPLLQPVVDTLTSGTVFCENSTGESDFCGRKDAANGFRPRLRGY